MPGTGGATVAEEFPVEKCSTCQANIIWATHEASLKPAPLDADPDPNGTFALRMTDGNVTYRTVPMAKRFGRRDLRLNHYAKCPQAGQHRNRGRVAA